MTQALAYCNFEGAKWLLFGPNVAPLVYYSHLPIIAISLILGIFVLFQNRRTLSNNVLFYTILAFVIWVLCDSIYWASNRSDVIMFVWSIDILVEPLVYIGGLYLAYVLVNKKDIPFNWKMSLAILYAPLVILLSTKFTLSSFDLETCLANEGPMALYYSYFIEIILIIWIIIFFVKRYLSSIDSQYRKKILYLSIGTLSFLVAFSWGNITGSFTDDWQLGQYGLFGMPVFIAFLAYTIVRFKLFNIKVIGANVLVITLWVATASLFAVQDINTSHAVIAATLILTTIFGFILINSVRKEVSQREKIENLAKDLEKVNENLTFANERQENLIHFINHQVKGFFTKSKYIFAALLEGDYGVLNKEMESIVKEGLRSDNEGIAMVEDILNASNVKSGAVKYNKSAMNFKELVLSVVSDQEKIACDKNLSFEANIDEEDYKILGDEFQLKNVVKNLIDNSIKYTPTGKVTVSLFKADGKILFSVKDTGVGLTKEDKQRLFTEGGKGKNSQKINVNSTGFGLFIAKNIVLAHNGKIWAESEGEGKGSQFYVELLTSENIKIQS